MRIPPGFAQVNYIFAGVAVPTGAECTMGIDVTENGLTPDALAEALFDAWGTADMPGLQTTEVALREVRVKYGPNEFGPTGTDTGSFPGETAAPTCPPNTSVLIRKSTAFGGKAGTGRLYIPCVAESFVDGTGALIGGYTTSRQTPVNAWLASFTTLDAPAVLLHDVGSPLYPTPSPITALTIQPRVATQRRRLRR